MSSTTVRESIKDLATLAHEIRTEHHLAEGTIVKIIEMVLQKQATDRQLSMNEAQLGLLPRNGLSVVPDAPEDNVTSITPDEVITGSDHPEGET